MKRLFALLVGAVFLYPLTADSVTQYKSKTYTNQGVSLALEDPIGSVYQDGEEVRFSIRTDLDAYVVVFNIDTEGFVHLLYPRDGKTLRRISPDRVYYLPEYDDESLIVGGAKGIEFVFALATPHRDDFNTEEIAFLLDNEKLSDERKFRIDGDPFLAANRIASQLIRGIAQRNGVSLSYTYFYINEAVDYPRYLCGDCYEKGKDPYGEGMPRYVAAADFETTDRLTYPLERGFAPEYEYESVADTGGSSGGGASVTRVYVSYYPRWDHGFYTSSWWYMDPWYWDWWYSPYYRGSWYFNIGWNWGWGAWHYYYFPYYYCGPYYACYPYYAYYSCYPGYCYYPLGRYWRTFRPWGKSATSTILHTAMDLDSRRHSGMTGRSLKSYGQSKRRTVASSVRPGGKRYSYKDGKYIRYNSKLAKRTGLKSRDVRKYTSVRGKGPRTDRSRKIISTKKPYRERRVITRSKVRSDRSRMYDRKSSKRTIRSRDFKPPSRTKSPKVRGTRQGSGSKWKPRSTRSKSSSKRVYKPNVRRGSNRKSSGSSYRAPSRRSSSRPSATRSRGSSGRRSTSSSKGKGRR
ncbi:MAG: DUF4384 domain-containing protein [Candidatus Latescibacterota bacterium]|nr:MAG: DUF4384 domain-containing protein [Candidatus Latescibacterota bacterium]